MVIREEGVPRERVAVVPNFVESAAFESLSPERPRRTASSLWRSA
jgi:hypothetical protein